MLRKQIVELKYYIVLVWGGWFFGGFFFLILSFEQYNKGKINHFILPSKRQTLTSNYYKDDQN